MSYKRNIRKKMNRRKRLGIQPKGDGTGVSWNTSRGLVLPIEFEIVGME